MLRKTLTLARFAPVLFLITILLVSARPAFARDGQDRVSFAQRIVVREDETVGDLVCFLCSIENHGAVQGDVVSFLGGVKNDGTIHGQAVSFLGDIVLTGEASVDGDLVVLGGNLRKSQNARSSKGQVVFPAAIFLLPFLLIFAILWAIIRVVRRPRIYYAPTR